MRTMSAVYITTLTLLVAGIHGAFHPFLRPFFPHPVNFFHTRRLPIFQPKVNYYQNPYGPHIRSFPRMLTLYPQLPIASNFPSLPVPNVNNVPQSATGRSGFENRNGPVNTASNVIASPINIGRGGQQDGNQSATNMADGQREPVIAKPIDISLGGQQDGVQVTSNITNGQVEPTVDTLRPEDITQNDPTNPGNTPKVIQ